MSSQSGGDHQTCTESLVVGKGQFLQVDYFTKLSNRSRKSVQEIASSCDHIQDLHERKLARRRQARTLLTRLKHKLIIPAYESYQNTENILMKAILLINELQSEAKQWASIEAQLRNKFLSLCKKRHSLVARRRFWIKSFVDLHWKDPKSIPNLSPTKDLFTSGDVSDFIDLDNDDKIQSEDQPCCSNSLSSS